MNGSRLLRKAKIKQLIKSRLGDSIMGTDELKQRLTDIARGTASRYSLKALELLGKVHGVYIERNDVNLKGSISWREFIEK